MKTSSFSIQSHNKDEVRHKKLQALGKFTPIQVHPLHDSCRMPCPCTHAKVTKDPGKIHTKTCEYSVQQVTHTRCMCKHVTVHAHNEVTKAPDNPGLLSKSYLALFMLFLGQPPVDDPREIPMPTLSLWVTHAKTRSKSPGYAQLITTRKPHEPLT